MLQIADSKAPYEEETVLVVGAPGNKIKVVFEAGPGENVSVGPISVKACAEPGRQ